MVVQILIYIVSFVGIWVGAGVAISSVERLSKSLRLSSFSISFLVLGLFTSISELSVGVNAVLANDPEIYVGNLIGASIVLFMMIIPILAIAGGGVVINNKLRGFNMIMSILVIAVPVLVAFDGKIDRIDSIAAVILYTILALGIQKKTGVLDKISHVIQFQKVKTGVEITRILVGVAIIFVSSHFVVEQTMFFSGVLGLSPFLISLLLISIGTNLPELSIVVRSIVMKNYQVAFGDYVGSAAFNTYLMGVLTLWHGKPVILANSYLVSLLFVTVGLILFYLFARSKNTISRNEGLVLLALYILFLLSEIVMH